MSRDGGSACATEVGDSVASRLLIVAQDDEGLDDELRGRPIRGRSRKSRCPAAPRRQHVGASSLAHNPESEAGKRLQVSFPEFVSDLLDGVAPTMNCFRDFCLPWHRRGNCQEPHS